MNTPSPAPSAPATRGIQLWLEPGSVRFFAVTALLVLVILLLLEGIHAVVRHRQRSVIFELAAKRARETGRKLVVIGDPYNGKQSRRVGAVYGCGDVCLDLTGCLRCPIGMAGDATLSLRTMPSDSAVIFLSCVLEYVPDPDALIREMERVAGGPENLFVVAVHPLCFTAFFYSDGGDVARNIITRHPPFSKTFSWHRNPFFRSNGQRKPE